MIASLMHGMLYGLLFALVSAVATVIAILASRGIPKTFDREMFWTCFAASGFGSAILILAAQRVARSGAGPRLVPTLLGDAGLFLFGVSLGCGAGIFVFKKRAESEDPKVISHEHDSGGSEQ